MSLDALMKFLRSHAPPAMRDCPFCRGWSCKRCENGWFRL